MKVQLLRLDVPNGNGRCYTTEAVEAAIKKLNGAPLLGTIGIPEPNGDGNSFINLDIRKVSHTVSNLRIEDGFLVGDMKILQTDPGSELSFMLDSVAFRPNSIGKVSTDGFVSDLTFVSVSAVDKEQAA